MRQPTVVIVNGGSSAGKTSICKAFQDISPEPWFLLGIDAFWFSMPPKEVDLETVSDSFYRWVEEEDSGKRHFRILPGPLLNESMLARYKAMAAFLDRGLNVVADEVFWSREWLEESLNTFAAYRTYYVGVYCEDDEMARREIQRGDRYSGWARGSQLYAHLDCKYDLWIDSTHSTPHECALLLQQYLNANPAPRAAIEMRSLRPVG